MKFKNDYRCFTHVFYQRTLTSSTKLTKQLRAQFPSAIVKTYLITRLWSSSSFLTPGATGTNFWESELHRSRMSLPQALVSLWRSNMDTHREALGAWWGKMISMMILVIKSQRKTSASYPDLSLFCTLPMVPCGSSPVTRFALASGMRKTKRLQRRLGKHCIV